MNKTSCRYGFFGKIPSVGDFVSRGLDASVVKKLDPWLSAIQREAEAAMHPVFCPLSLDQTAIFRFLLGAGVLSERCWAGLLAASCDSVGRLFPLVLLHELVDEQAGWELSQEDQSWFEDFEDVVHACHAQRLPPERLQEILARFVPSSVESGRDDSGHIQPETAWWWLASRETRPLSRGLPDLSVLNGVFVSQADPVLEKRPLPTRSTDSPV